MDYMVQMEKLFKYLNLNLEVEDKIILLKLKQNFNNDLNLMGCFLKDYLTIKNPEKISDDNRIYSDFVLYFEKSKKEKKEILLDVLNYSKHYLTIVFEDTDNIYLQNTIGVINSCFALDSYPYLMILMNNYQNKKINSNSFITMLKLISDAILERFENTENLNKDFSQTKIANEILNKSERLVS